MHLGGIIKGQTFTLVKTLILFTLLFTFRTVAAEGDLAVPSSDVKLSTENPKDSSEPQDLSSRLFQEDRITLEFMTITDCP